MKAVCEKGVRLWLDVLTQNHVLRSFQAIVVSAPEISLLYSW